MFLISKKPAFAFHILTGFGLLLSLLCPVEAIHCYACEDAKDSKCAKQKPFDCSTEDPTINTCLTSVGRDSSNGKLENIYKGCGRVAGAPGCLKEDEVKLCFCVKDLCNGYYPEDFQMAPVEISLLTIAAVFLGVGLLIIFGLIVRSRARLLMVARSRNLRLRQAGSLYFI